MAKNNSRRALDRREAMLSMLEEGATLEQVGSRFGGLSRQRVSVIVGPLHREPIRNRRVPQRTRVEVVKLVRRGYGRAEIAELTQISLNDISSIAHDAGFWFKSGNQPYWTRQRVLDAAIDWESRYGSWPKAVEWTPNMASQHADRIKRYRDFRPPIYTTVRKHFDSFPAMIEAAKRRKRYLAGRSAT